MSEAAITITTPRGTVVVIAGSSRIGRPTNNEAAR